ncbi:MAG: trypsin-like peptidase domain-containing protein [Planctomycetales bacterium]|nr:trypsin-like peptidase domain-containing protein [Planctomycetales bacterium]
MNVPVVATIVFSCCLGCSSLGFCQIIEPENFAAVENDANNIREKGFLYLVNSQSIEGSWRNAHEGPGTTGLALIALLSSEEDPNNGPYSRAIHSALRFIIRSQDPVTGYMGESMYHHAYATLALAKANGHVNDGKLWESDDPSSPHSAVAKALELAVQCTLKAQSKNGHLGWRYSPTSRDTDTSVTGTVLISLLAAREAGIEVPAKAIDDAFRVIDNSTSENGAISYFDFATGSGGNKSITRSSLACLAQVIAKRTDSPHFEAIRKYVERNVDEQSEYPEYARFYISQALYLTRPEAWQLFHARLVTKLKREQEADGSISGSLGAGLATPLSLLALAPAYIAVGIPQSRVVVQEPRSIAIEENNKANVEATEQKQISRRDVIDAAKSATALVVRDRRFQASAFCIEPSGWFVTNHHVLGDDATVGKTVSLVVDAGEPNQRVLDASVVRIDSDLDLALLWVTGGEFKALQLGNDAAVFETTPVLALGFPFGTLLSGSNEYPAISVTAGAVSALRKKQGVLERIQFSNAVNPGNSGGPVVDLLGQVIGMVESGIIGTGVNFAIPVSHVRHFVSKPVIEFDIGAISPNDLSTELDVPIDVRWILEPPNEFEVSMEVSVEGMPARPIPVAQQAGEKFLAKWVPVPGGPGPAKLQVHADFSHGSIAGQVVDQHVTVGETKYLLSDLRAIDFSDASELPKVVTSDQTQRANVGGLSRVRVSIGKSELEVDLAQAKRLTIAPAEPDLEGFNYRLVVTSQGSVMAGKSGRIDIQSATEQRDHSRSSKGVSPVDVDDLDQSKFDGAKKVVELTSQAYSYTIGAGGRYMLMHLKDESMVAILDLNDGQLAFAIKDVTEDVLIAAGRERFVLVFPGDSLIQRWRFDGFQRERVDGIPSGHVMRYAQMGCNSDGPLYLAATDSNLLIDLQTMAPLELEGAIPFPHTDGHVPYMSTDGTTIGLAGRTPNRVTINQKNFFPERIDYKGQPAAWCWPSADGSYISCDIGIFDKELERVEAKWLEHCTLFPTIDPRYFVALEIPPHEQSHGETPARLHICTMCDRHIVYTYVGIDEVPTTDASAIRSQLARGFERLKYFPVAKMLVTFDAAAKRVFLRKLDFVQAMLDRDQQFVFVDSLPPHQVSLGSEFRYQIEGKSNTGELQYHLESGPEGMTVDSRGVVSWLIPESFPSENVRTIVSVTNGKNKEVLHSFTLSIVNTKKSSPDR